MRTLNLKTGENAAFFEDKDAAQIVVSAEHEIRQNVKSTRWLGEAVDG
jgi:hypothetical protein